MRLPWRRHRCPSSVVLEIRIDGRTVIGPASAEELGLIAKYASGCSDYPFDLMGDCLYGPVRRIEVLATYQPRTYPDQRL
jgi:hypothetical protein